MCQGHSCECGGNCEHDSCGCENGSCSHGSKAEASKTESGSTQAATLRLKNFENRDAMRAAEKVALKFSAVKRAKASPGKLEIAYCSGFSESNLKSALKDRGFSVN